MKKSSMVNFLIELTHKTIIDEFDQDISDINADTFFIDLGLNSCDRAVIASKVIESLSVDVRIEDILMGGTVNGMVELIFSNAKLSQPV